MKEKTHIYEFVSHTSRLHEVVGTVWWNGSKVEADNWRVLHKLKKLNIYVHGKHLTIKDGPPFLDALPYHFRNGYLTVRKATQQ